jgi:hydrogenase expression/formation protein HypD
MHSKKYSDRKIDFNMFRLRDKKLASEIIKSLKKLNLKLRFMHVCGTHQDTLVRHGLDILLKNCDIDIRQGPGCPVCVTTPKEIEEAMLLARKNIAVATFGDMLNVPGEKYSLQNLKEKGHPIHMVYSIEDAVEIARRQKNKEVVFMAIGFETTAPTTATVILNEPPSNFSILSCHRLIPPAVNALLDMGEVKIDGMIEPGHVSTIIGLKPYEGISRKHKIPQVVAGFEPVDLLMAAYMLALQIKRKEAKVENEYIRLVKPEGNPIAIEKIKAVFETSEVSWRGFPSIPNSGLILKEKFSEYDARKKFEDILTTLEGKEFREPAGCKCSDVLRGLITSQECPLFGKACAPSHPVGPCMVSREGSCNIEFRYLKK